MSTQTRESRPGGDRAAISEVVLPGGANESIVPTAPDDDHDTAAEYFRTSFAVLVRGRSVRRHLYFNLPAAERAVKRARARGDRADLVLVQLVPVLTGGAS